MKTKNERQILMTGNEACGEGAVQAGCRFYAGYPITPQNELTAYMSKRMDEEGGTFIQAESELAAISMVFGASVAGARAMTSSSSPGISLKQEGISYLAGCQLPAVIINIMRGGPGLGNIAPAQSDYFQATRGGGHGDYRTIALAPASVPELMDLTREAFDLADEYRMPVMVLGDGILGQMMEPVSSFGREIPNSKSQNPNKFQIPNPNKPWALTGCAGRKPNVIKSLWLGEGELEALNEKLQKRYEIIKEKQTRFEAVDIEDADVVLVAYGTISRIARAAMKAARAKGIKAGLIRPITLWPFPSQVIGNTAKRIKKFLVVEMSEGQMLEDVLLAASGACKVDFHGRSGGGVPTEEEILKCLQNQNR